MRAGHQRRKYKQHGSSLDCVQNVCERLSSERGLCSRIVCQRDYFAGRARIKISRAGSCGSGHGGAMRARGIAKATAKGSRSLRTAKKTRATGGCKSIAAASMAQAARWAWRVREAGQAIARAGRLDLARAASEESPQFWLASRFDARLLETIRPVATCMQIEMATSPRSRASGWEHLSARLDPA